MANQSVKLKDLKSKIQDMETSDIYEAADEKAALDADPTEPDPSDVEAHRTWKAQEELRKNSRQKRQQAVGNKPANC